MKNIFLILALFLPLILSAFPEEKRSPLDSAVRRRDLASARKILEKHPDLEEIVILDGMNYSLGTILMQAARLADQPMFDLLVSAGANPRRIVPTGSRACAQNYNSVLAAVMLSGNVKFADAYLARYVNAKDGKVELDARDRDVIVAFAARGGSRELLKRALALGGEINAVNRATNYCSALGWAAQRNDFAMVDDLLAAGADPNAVDPEEKRWHGFNSSHPLSSVRSVEMLHRLEKAGMNLDASEAVVGSAYIHLAKEGSDFVVLRHLIERGTLKPDMVDAYGNSIAAALAANWGIRIADLQWFMSRKNFVMPQKFDILENLIRKGDLEQLKLFLSNGLDPDLVDRQMRNAIFLSAQYDRPEFVRFFVENGVNLNARDVNNRNAYHYAEGNPKMLQLLKSLGAQEY